MDSVELIQHIRKELLQFQERYDKVPPDKIVEAAKKLYQNIAPLLTKLKKLKQDPSDPELVECCEKSAKQMVRSARRYFTDWNKNNTVYLDELVRCASNLIADVHASEEIKKKIEKLEKDLHWHGW